jgi:hypothetical protein
MEPLSAFSTFPISDSEDNVTTKNGPKTISKKRKEHKHRKKRHRWRSRSQTSSSDSSDEESSKQGKNRNPHRSDKTSVRKRRRATLERSPSHCRKDISEPKSDSLLRNYYFDRRGDEGNLVYGRIDRQSVPVYRVLRVSPIGSCLFHPKTNGSGYHPDSKEQMLKMSQHPFPAYSITRPVKLGGQDDDTDFIAINHDTIDDAFQVEEINQTVQHPCIKIQSQLNQRISVDPSDVEAWIQLIDHQWNLYHSMGTSIDSTLNKQVAICDRALRKNIGNERLLVKRLTLTIRAQGLGIAIQSNVLNDADTWIEMKERYPQFGDFALEYLKWVQCVGDFNYHQCREQLKSGIPRSNVSSDCG